MLTRDSHKLSEHFYKKGGTFICLSYSAYLQSSPLNTRLKDQTDKVWVDELICNVLSLVLGVYT